MTHPLSTLVRSQSRVVVGLMSGTSLDGVDAAVVRLQGTGRAVEIGTLAFVSVPYAPQLREALGSCVETERSNVRMVSQLSVRLAHHFAEVAREAVQGAGLSLADVDLVGSHGQTVQHVPSPEACAGIPTRSTLQIGCPATLATLLGTPVISDFRTADMALGGQGAPLAPYLDGAVFGSADETRVLLNLGGIANVTILPAGQAAHSAFDTGPANMVIDALALRLTGKPYDQDGALAASGTPDEAMLADLLADPYYAAAPPKSTGREIYGAAFVDRFIADGTREPADLLATATALTARSVALGISRFSATPPARVIASGGGVHNPTLMAMLGEAVAPAALETTAAYGLDPDAKEAVLFALLAHEWANGVRTGLPAVTGASAAAFQGSLTLP